MNRRCQSADFDRLVDPKTERKNIFPRNRLPQSGSTAKRKRQQTFIEDYSEKWTFIISSNKGGNYARCTLCRCEISIAHGGSNDINRHIETAKHRSAANEAGSATISQDLNTKDNFSSDIGVFMTRFLIKHNIPFSESDHLTSLMKKMFPDSSIAQKLVFGKTEATAIARSLGQEAEAMSSSPNAGMQNSTDQMGCSGQQAAPTTESAAPINPSSSSRDYAARRLQYGTQPQPGPEQQSGQTPQQLPQQMDSIITLGANQMNMGGGAMGGAASACMTHSPESPSTGADQMSMGGRAASEQPNEHSEASIPPSHNAGQLKADGSGGSAMGELSSATSLSTGSTEIDWHKEITHDLRNQFVHILFQAASPTPDPTALKRQRMENLVAYARKVEGDTYKSANSKDEYYHFLAERIYKIRKKLEKRRSPKALGPGTQAGSPPRKIDSLSTSKRKRLQTSEEHCSKKRTRIKLPTNEIAHGGSNDIEFHIKSVNNQSAVNEEEAMSSSPNAGMQNSTDQMGCSGQQAAPTTESAAPINPSSSSRDDAARGLQYGTQLQSGPEQQSAQTPQQLPQQMDSINTLGANQMSMGGGAMGGAASEQPNEHSDASIPPPHSAGSDGSAMEDLPIATLGSACSTETITQEITPDLRNYLLDKLCKRMIATSPPQDLAAKKDLVAYAEKVEEDMHKSANSRHEYHHFMAEMCKMYKSQKKPEEEWKSQLPKTPPGASEPGFSQLKALGPGTQAGSPPNGPVPMPDVPNQIMNRVPRGIHQSGPMEMRNAQMQSQAPKGSCAASPMNHPVQTNMGSVPAQEEETRLLAAENKEPDRAESELEPMEVEDKKLEVEAEPIKEEEGGANSSATSTSSSQPRKKIFKPAEMRQALMPTLEALYRQDPESLPFRQPVDPMLLDIPDYFDIVKSPMDLSTIKRKLDTGQYQEPWQYVDDVWLMFNNAWLYNCKTSRVYKYCSKLVEVFEQRINSFMQGLGYCCGRKYEFSRQTLCCYGKQLCTISWDATYYSYQNRYHFCKKCFNKIQGDRVTLGDDPAQPQTMISKDQFEKKKNDMLDPEPFVECKDCGRKMHQICVLHYDVIWPAGFICNNCLKTSGKTQKVNKFAAKRLQTTKLSMYIENRVNKYLKRQNHPEAGEVFVRVVASSDKTVEVRPGMKSRFVDTGEMAESFPYRTKALFAFEEIDGVDVCFFGMHVQEYGSECPFPNTRRVYISYLDSIHFFRPRMLRTPVYHEILIGYLEYVKKLGFMTGHIWACPPSKGDDYIFHCHPPDQKIPKPKRLQEWYRKMLDKAFDDRVVHDYKDIFKQATEDRLISANELPYFEGDFWPNVLEESIKELEQEEEVRKREENTASCETPEGTSTDSKNAEKKGKATNKNKGSISHSNNKPGRRSMANDLSQKLYDTLEKHKEVFFVIHLHSGPMINTLPPIMDPDPLLSCDLMDGRDAFLTLARDKHWEFSSLRRCKWSSMCMLVELHNQGQDRFVYTCNECKHHVETRWHCTVCEDFDLCINCYNIKGHEHQMVKWGLGLDDDSNSSGAEASKSPQESRRLSIQRCIQSLVHACQCRNANCSMASCQKMKRVVQHTKGCKRKTNGGCPVCKQLIALCCYHAKHCQENKCPVPFCLNIKLQHRLQQAQMMRRRMATMQGRGVAPSLPSPPTPSAPGTPTSLPQQQKKQQLRNL